MKKVRCRLKVLPLLVAALFCAAAYAQESDGELADSTTGSTMANVVSAEAEHWDNMRGAVDDYQQPTRAAIVSSATQIEGCNAGLIMFNNRLTCRSNVTPIIDPTKGAGGSAGNAAEAHAWGVPGMTGGFDVGYNAMGQTDSNSEGSAGPGTSTSGGGDSSGGSSSGGGV